MSRARVKFGKNVPKWLQRATTRWACRLLPADWTLQLEMADASMLEQQHGDGTRAVSTVLIQYLDIAIWMADDHVEDEDAYRTLVHELLHCKFQAITQIFDQAWDGRKKMTRLHAQRLLSDKIEELIQRDVGILLRAWRR